MSGPRRASEDPLIGKRVRLVHTSDQYTNLRPGAEGVVTNVDDMGTIHVSWDDGHRLGLIVGEDRWEMVT
jgi:hypothetical protein